MAIMAMTNRRYALVAVALGVAGLAFVLWPERAVVPPPRSVGPGPISSGSACRQVPEAAVADTDERLLHHVIGRAGYGPRPGDVDRLREVGVAAYLERQLTPENISDSALEKTLEAFETQRMSAAERV